MREQVVMSSGLRVRIAKHEDAQAIRALRAWVGWNEELVDTWFAQMNAGQRIMWVAEVGDALAGMVALDLSDESEPDLADGHSRAAISSLAVLSMYQNRGVGRALTETAEQEARQRDFAWITLKTSTKNEVALALYQKLGYQVFKQQEKSWGLSIYLHKPLR